MQISSITLCATYWLMGVCLWTTSSAAQAQYFPFPPPPCLTCSLTPSLPTVPSAPEIRHDPIVISALRAEPPILLVIRAMKQPASIQVRAVAIRSSEALELGQLVGQLAEIDRQLLQYNRDLRTEHFYNLINTLLAAVTKQAPDLASSLEESLPNIRALMAERREAERQIRRIVTPGSSMRPAPYVEATRTNGSLNFEVYKSAEATPGAVNGPSPLCHREQRSHAEYRNILLPDGFDGAGTPLYRNEYHPFPVSEMVDVCP